MNTKGSANIDTFIISLPEVPIASTVPPSTLIPAMISVRLTTAVDSAPPILLMRGCTEKVMDSLRLPSFHWPYSTVSARNISISV